MVGPADRRRRRRRRLHHRRLGVNRARARVVILALPQLAADKADCDHGSVAANHFSALAVQLRESAYPLHVRAQGIRKPFTAVPDGTRVPGVFQGIYRAPGCRRFHGKPAEFRRGIVNRDLDLESESEGTWRFFAGNLTWS